MRVMSAPEILRAGRLWANGRNTHDISILMMIAESVVAANVAEIRRSSAFLRTIRI